MCGGEGGYFISASEEHLSYFFFLGIKIDFPDEIC